MFVEPLNYSECFELSFQFFIHYRKCSVILKYFLYRFFLNTFCIIFPGLYINFQKHQLCAFCICSAFTQKLLKSVFVYLLPLTTLWYSHMSPLLLLLLFYLNNPFCKFFSVVSLLPFLYSNKYVFNVFQTSFDFILLIFLFDIFNALKLCTIKCLAFHRINVKSILSETFFLIGKFSQPVCSHHQY